MNKILIIIVLILSLITLNNNTLPNLLKKNKELLQGGLFAGLVTMILHKPLIENLDSDEHSCSEAEPDICGDDGTFNVDQHYNNEPEKECCVKKKSLILSLRNEYESVPEDGSCKTWIQYNTCTNGSEPEPDSFAYNNMYEPDGGEPDGEEPEDVCCNLSLKGIALYIVISLVAYGFIWYGCGIFENHPNRGIIVTFAYALILFIVAYKYNIGYKIYLPVILLGSAIVLWGIYSRTQEKKNILERQKKERDKENMQIQAKNRKKKEKTDQQLVSSAPSGVSINIGGEYVKK
tara:strand:- start:50 stop:922 length:873 start_codon:yes stop_codon:yes gene_type:complete